MRFHEITFLRFAFPPAWALWPITVQRSSTTLVRGNAGIRLTHPISVCLLCLHAQSMEGRRSNCSRGWACSLIYLSASTSFSFQPSLTGAGSYCMLHKMLCAAYSTRSRQAVGGPPKSCNGTASKAETTGSLHNEYLAPGTLKNSSKKLMKEMKAHCNGEGQRLRVVLIYLTTCLLHGLCDTSHTSHR